MTSLGGSTTSGSRTTYNCWTSNTDRTWDVYAVVERPKHGTPTTTDLAILEGHSKAGDLADLAGTEKERSSGR
jgi:hypothetical protein